jgi:Fe2+ transport system protein FeoA
MAVGGEEGAVDVELKEGMVRRDVILIGGINPGAEVRVIDKHPFDGPLVVEVAGHTRTLGERVARKVYVTRVLVGLRLNIPCLVKLAATPSLLRRVVARFRGARGLNRCLPHLLRRDRSVDEIPPSDSELFDSRHIDAQPAVYPTRVEDHA